MLVYLSLFLSALFLTGASKNFNKTSKGSGKQRDGKFLPLFQVVKFPNDPCDAANNITGTCYTSDECSNKGGESSGICANGFGVCCVFQLACGKTSSYNNSYLDSTKSTIGQSCSYKICPLSTSITRIKFDFLIFNLVGPFSSTTTDATGGAIGDCITDSFSISSPGSVGTPVICGKNSGQHVIVSSSPLCNTVLFNFGPSSDARSWKIRVIQYSFASEDVSGSPGCLQYFYKESGTISSFNFNLNNPVDSTHLSNQHYVICIRRAVGKCKICFDAKGIDNFGLSIANSSISIQNPPSIMYTPGRLNDDCMTDYIGIPGGVNSQNPNFAYRLCGRIFGKSEASSTSHTADTVCTPLTPFMITFRTDQDETVDGSTKLDKNEVAAITGNTPARGTLGFLLYYSQLETGC